MRTQAEKAGAFRALHERPGVFIMPRGFTWVRDTVPSKELKAVFAGWQ